MPGVYLGRSISPTNSIESLVIMEDKLKFKIERFNGEKIFTLWNERVNDILVDRDFMKALLAKTMKPPEIRVDWMEIQEKMVRTIRNVWLLR